MMLKRIPAIMLLDLVKTLMKRGHGDETVIYRGSFIKNLSNTFRAIIKILISPLGVFVG